MKVFLVGDIVGSGGRTALARVVTRWKQDGKVDFVVANAENSAGGKGLTGGTAEELLATCVDVITLGDHTWDQREFAAWLDRADRVVRPLNFAPGCPGRGYTVVETGGCRVMVVNLIGRVFMKPYDCPFRAVDEVLRREGGDGRVTLVDMHAEATSEKIVMGRYLEGRVAAVVGTHTHVQTSDETVLPGGTAYITDLGMTGAKDSALGRDLASVTQAFLTGMPTKFKMARDDVAVEGLIVDVDERTGRARRVTRVRECMEASSGDGS